MYKFFSSVLIVLIISQLSISCKESFKTSQDCVLPEITDTLDLAENIPGKSMGQKLESLLFWSQAEKERRFPMMQSIFPSLPIEAGSQTYLLKEGKKITPQWKDSTHLNQYMNENHIGGLVVLKDNEIRLEAYGGGVDQHTLWTSYSVAKSVSSLLVGAALKDGNIESLADPLEKYIPEFKGYDYGKVTVKQLLTMTSGIAWNEDYEDHNSDVAQMYLQDCNGNEPHILTYMKNLKAVHKPGEKWNYSTGETDLVGILIQKATGKSLATYLSEKIWKPFGMQQCAYWLTDECSGMNIGGSGLSASLTDYARLGIFMLQDGQIDKTPILAQAYLDEATLPLYATNDEGGGYGYLWWHNPDGSYAAHGIFGQLLYINPTKNIVIAQIAAWPQAGSKALSQSQKEMIEAVERAL